ncbi:hypothetical protein PsorP6_011179 [Peronosclerospora sorghi]|uniref:Uncharacterized protein n=1 Tax=Peronosclerospora sorghi TaxID=230839 RepID=A0ACC0VXV9_9STRA|nr:hypothetical protein PsorP6_011179 [Peronosclerospora sorghi]
MNAAMSNYYTRIAFKKRLGVLTLVLKTARLGSACIGSSWLDGGAESIGVGSAWLRLGAMKCGSAQASHLATA